MHRDPVLPGQESVWDYPRPPKLEPSTKHIVVKLNGEIVADSYAAYRVLETSHPPSWYIPPADTKMDKVQRESKSSHCEWKGSATYWTVTVGGVSAENAAWSYAQPTGPFKAIAGYLAFYPSVFECFVDDEQVAPQPGGFYGGWVTKDVAGPFKGGPGSWGW